MGKTRKEWLAPRKHRLGAGLLSCIVLACAFAPWPFDAETRGDIHEARSINAGPPQVSITPPKPVNPELGQWIWTRKDAAIFRDVQNERATIMEPRFDSLQAGIWVATVVLDDAGHPIARRANSPGILEQGIPISLVVRFDDAFHKVWQSTSTADVFDQVGPMLRNLLKETAATGTLVREIQLDYDCPSRRLQQWATVVVRLKKEEFRKLPIWLTSIPVHLQNQQYWEQVRPSIEGHILQLFDTGLACNRSKADELKLSLIRSNVPFRVGLGAFERGETRPETFHDCWARISTTFAQLPGYRGVWVFPAGHSYQGLIRHFEPAPTASQRFEP